MTTGILFHIIAGAIALLSGAAALCLRKGSKYHKLSGNIFVVSMLLMATTGLVFAYLRSVGITMLAAALTLYLVSTSWLSVQHRFKIEYEKQVSVLLGLVVVLYGSYLSFQALRGVTDNLGEYSVPAAIYLVFTAIALLALVFDIRKMLFGASTGNQRVMGHLWRMCASLYIACSSFFQGQQQVFPEIWQGTVYLSIPENLVLLLMLFWLFKYGLQNRRKAIPHGAN